MIDPKEFQGAVLKWNTHNFPNGPQNKHWCLLGIVEEVGELTQAIKADDKISSVDDMKDAIGDCMVFMAAFCGFNGFSLYQVCEQYIDTYSPVTHFKHLLIKELPILVGKLCHHFLKDQQNIRGHHHQGEMKVLIGKLSSLLGAICLYNDWDFLEVIDSVWSEVSKRDWKKYPKNGMPDGEIVKKKPLDQTRKPSVPGKFKLTLAPKVAALGKDDFLF